VEIPGQKLRARWRTVGAWKHRVEERRTRYRFSREGASLSSPSRSQPLTRTTSFKPAERMTIQRASALSAGNRSPIRNR
jgi:hypothetical protein